MKQFLDYADIFITAPCYLGYLWMADKFCKRYLETSKEKELLFVSLSFVGWLFLNVLNRKNFALHILFLLAEHVLFVGLVLLLFRAGWEKKILAASILMTVMRLVLNITEPCLSCLILFYKHMVKKIPEPFLNEVEAGVVCYIGFCLVMLAIFWLSKYLTSVFCGKKGKWYIMLAAPLLAVMIVLDVANWGACYGIMIRSGGNMGLYYDQIFSHTEFCALAVIFMSAVEACEKQGVREAQRGARPYIYVHAGTVKKCFLLEVTNSTGVTELSKNRHTEKGRLQERGIGLLNVSDVVERYDGAMNTETQDGVFVISVLIPLEKAVHDMERVV